MKRRHPLHYRRFYLALGQRVKRLRRKRGYTQEDMISFGFGLRHWQQIEAGYRMKHSDLAADLRGFQRPRLADASVDSMTNFPTGNTVIYI